MSDYKKQPIPPRLREKVFARDGHTCRYCGSKSGPFQADHVYPESKGGETTMSNLVTACKKCNNKKRAKIGIWPLPVEYFDNSEIERLRRSEQLQKNVASGYRRKYQDKDSNYRNLWALIAQYAFVPLSFAYGMTAYNTELSDVPIAWFRELVILFIGVAFGMAYAAFVYWRRTR